VTRVVAVEAVGACEVSVLEVAALEAPALETPALETPELEVLALEVRTLDTAEVAELAVLVTVDETGAAACDTEDVAGAAA
jgi:hypothetical protein